MSPFAEAGFSIHEIAAWSGHADLREIARYTKAADQTRMAWAGAAKLIKERTGSVKPTHRFDKKAKIAVRKQRPKMRMVSAEGLEPSTP